MDENESMDSGVNLAELTADVVAAYVANNPLPISSLPTLIQDVHKALDAASKGASAVEEAPKNPAVPIRRSVTDDQIACLECGLKFQSLKRHLRTYHNATPEEYRSKWGLPADYPMVAANYSARRADLAKKIGLGSRRRK